MSGAAAEAAALAAGLYKRYAEIEAVSGIDFRISFPLDRAPRSRLRI
jgi:hypothetical protein